MAALTASSGIGWRCLYQCINTNAAACAVLACCATTYGAARRTARRVGARTFSSLTSAGLAARLFKGNARIRLHIARSGCIARLSMQPACLCVFGWRGSVAE